MVAQLSPSYPVSSARPAAVRAATARREALLDADFVRRFNSGDEEAFGEIITRYRGKMLAIALSVLRNHTDAEEIVQDTFIQAYRSLARFRGDCSLATWLYLIALNLSRNRYWYFFRRHRQDTCSFDSLLGRDDKGEIADLLPSEVPDPARAEANREFLAQVAICMGKLPAQQREILALRNLLDQSYEEIAETLGLNLGTVKSRIARARKSLRGLLGETYAEVGLGAASSVDWFEPNRPLGSLAAAGG